MRNETPDTALARVAREQEGVFSRRQARAAGFSARQVEHRIATLRWESTLPRVFRLAGTPRSKPQSLWIAALWAGDGALLSHRNAGELWKLDGVVARRPELWVPSPRAPRSPHVLVHRTLVLPLSDRRHRNGLPLTSPERTLIDLAGVLDNEGLEVAFESARREGLVTPESVDRRLTALGGTGRPGTARMRALLEAQQTGEAPLESRLEVKVARLLRASDLPRPVRQMWVTIRGRRYRLDFAWPDRMIAVECDGFDPHGGHRAFRRDRAKWAALGSSGWRMIPVTWTDVTREPGRLLTLVADALAAP